MSENKKELKRRYRQELPPMGIYVVRHNETRKSLVGSSMNLTGILNRHQFELKQGTHKNKALQADWKKFGPDAFSFEVADRLEQKEEEQHDYASELKVLLELWIEKFAEEGDRERY